MTRKVCPLLVQIVKLLMLMPEKHIAMIITEIFLEQIPKHHLERSNKLILLTLYKVTQSKCTKCKMQVLEEWQAQIKMIQICNGLKIWNAQLLQLIKVYNTLMMNLSNYLNKN